VWREGEGEKENAKKEKEKTNRKRRNMHIMINPGFRRRGNSAERSDAYMSILTVFEFWEERRRIIACAFWKAWAALLLLFPWFFLFFF
jgi:hypothetical protein